MHRILVNDYTDINFEPPKSFINFRNYMIKNNPCPIFEKFNNYNIYYSLKDDKSYLIFDSNEDKLNFLLIWS
jgi:hypothetical protein